MHYQLSYLLYSVFTHDITKSYLNWNQHLSFRGQQELKKLMGFGQNKQQYFQKKAKELKESEMMEIPCLSWMQWQINRIEMSEQAVRVENERQYINFGYLE